MAYWVELDVFQGPLDLLLYLLKEQEIEVRDIPVAEVTARYWEFLRHLGETDAEAMEEFLLLGAELLALKARLLLNLPSEGAAGEEEPDEEASRPEEELARRMEEYRPFKKAAEVLALLAGRASLSYGRPLEAEAVVAALARVDPLEGVTLVHLQRAYRGVLLRLEEDREARERVHTVKRLSITLRGQQRIILRCLYQVKGKLTFRSLLRPQPSRLEVATTLVALLELVRRGRVYLYQPQAFAEIEVWRKE
ncbi:MAG: segregation/condensation protein A [Thermoanaerobacteraceae bacterium]|uniref:segregation and condensation protein A n=1 Tax=Thermanaeromonas sp. C210 TaxID=2731925 RepID=UPI00155C5A33|nr:segregation/condensation protein A [Thermanaeromonas sp. C210]MBE3582416.1 segregation/condensation protein A [Thermoanaerobacteraceae bacterium]GFN23435.1 segregation and condensation protein A [Thermanaeromonas sp. C210]